MNDFDIWQRELRKIDLTTAVAPIVRGVMLVEDNQVDAYNKIQKLLNCPELESSHRFLYSLDPTELTEAEATKVANLYQLGVDRGFIAPEQDDEENSETSDQGDSTETANDADDSSQKQAQPPIQSEPVNLGPQAAYTVLYSAMRNGQIKSGEAFSNSVNTRSAKADVISKLERAGYTNISILAIEAGDPDAQGDCSNTYVKLPDATIPDYSKEDDVKEDDMLNGRVHNNHVAEDDVEEDDMLNGKLHNLHVAEDDVEEDDMLNGRLHNAHVDEGDDKEEDKSDSSDSKEDDSKEDDSKDDESKDDDKSDEDKDEDSKDSEKKDNKKEEDPEEPDEKLKSGDDEEKELSNEEKGPLRDSYKKAFKAALQKCKFTVSFSELSLEQKVDFFTALSKAWGSKPDPSKFMSDKEIEQLEKIVVKNP